MDKRKKFFPDSYKFIKYFYFLSFILICVFCLRLFIISMQYGPSSSTARASMIFIFGIWFAFVFLLFKAREEKQFYGFLNRILKEIEDFKNHKREKIFFRKKKSWEIEFLRDVLNDGLEDIYIQKKLYIQILSELKDALIKNDSPGISMICDKCSESDCKTTG